MIKLPSKYDYLEITEEISQFLDVVMNTDSNIALIGGAGVGKTEILKLLSDRDVYNHNCIVGCPTGIAAVNASTDGVRAQTLHSLFRLPPLGIIPPEKLKVHEDLAPLMKALHTLIIDEVSMVNSDLLTKILFLLGQYRNGEPIRLILIGDPSQLAPIVKSGDESAYLQDMYKGQFFFNTDIFQSMRILQLTKVFRQKDLAFKEVLRRFRFNKQTDEDIDFINTRYMDIDDFRDLGGEFIHIALTNRTVNNVNEKELELNKNPTKTYMGKNYYYPERELPVPLNLNLKMDTQVMIVANNRAQGYYNGQLGKVVGLYGDRIEIASEGKIYSIEPFTWERYKYAYNKEKKTISANVNGSFKQFPVKIGYAITSHKSQGLTLDRVYLDLERNTFASGQLYTALSRVTTLEGLGLARRVKQKDNKLNKKVKKFYKKNKIA